MSCWQDADACVKWNQQLCKAQGNMFYQVASRQHTVRNRLGHFLSILIFSIPSNCCSRHILCLWLEKGKSMILGRATGKPTTLVFLCWCQAWSQWGQLAEDGWLCLWHHQHSLPWALHPLLIGGETCSWHLWGEACQNEERIFSQAWLAFIWRVAFCKKMWLGRKHSAVF